MIKHLEGINRNTAIANILLVANAFIWYLIAFNMLKELLMQINATTTETVLIIGINTGAIVIAGLIGSFLINNFKNRKRFLQLWIASGILLSIIPLALNILDFSHIVLISLVFGAYFGIGMPATMGLHSTVTKTEERAKFGGFTFLIIGIFFSIAGIIIFNSLIASCLILAFIRLIGLVFFYPIRKIKQISEETSTELKYTRILSNKSFILFFIPWCLFTLINYMAIPIQNSIFSAELEFTTLMAIEYVIIALFAVISGLVADKFGRKRLSIIGFMMLGIGYAIIVFLSNINLYLTGIIYVLIDGVAWGIFYVLFIFTLWGDLANNKKSDKIYFLGVLPFVSSYFIQLIVEPYLVGIPKEMIFSFASVFLFIAILPLIYAPETLPEKIMKDRDLKSYIEKAKKKAAKDAEKANKRKTEQKTQNDEKSDTSDEDKNYENAKRLAEKYY